MVMIWNGIAATPARIDLIDPGFAGYYQREVEIDNSGGGALTDYQVYIELDYSANMDAEFDDIRFYNDEAGTVELPYWRETYTASTDAIFWVKVPSIAGSTTTIIYMRYGQGETVTTSDIRATFIDADDFNRAGLTETQPWTKDAGNPLTGYGYGDPFVFYESSTFYIFAGSFTGGGLQGIRLFTAPLADPADLTDEGEILALGGGGTWDDHWVSDVSIVKVGSTYHMFYSGADGTGVTGIKIGHATASAIDGTYTKDGSNPVFSKASNGTNEPSVTHDGTTFRMTYTYATTGGATDVSHKNIGYATSSDGTSWSDVGQLMAGKVPQNSFADYGGDQFQIQDADGLWHLFFNDGPSGGAAEMYHSTATSLAGPWTPPSRGGVIDRGGTYDVNAAWAPSIVLVSGTYYMYYQAQDGTGAKLAVATSSTLSRFYSIWKEVDFTNEFTISSNRFFKTSGDSSWNRAQSQGPLKKPPYIVETDLAFSAYSSGDAFGVYIADNATYNWAVVFNLGTDQMALWQVGFGSYTDTTTTYPLATGENGYKLRATVTASTISIDWFDGSTWNTGVLDTTGQTLIESACGYYGFGNSANQFYADYFRARKYASPEPTTTVGAES